MLGLLISQNTLAPHPTKSGIWLSFFAKPQIFFAKHVCFFFFFFAKHMFFHILPNTCSYNIEVHVYFLGPFFLVILQNDSFTVFFFFFSLLRKSSAISAISVQISKRPMCF